MQSIPVARSLAQLPVAELEQTLASFLAPMSCVLPDARLRRVLPLAIAGIVASKSPQVTLMAQPVSRRLPLAVEWLRRLGGKLGWAIDQDGVYILLCGLAAVWQAVVALTHLERHLFPGQGCR